MIRATKVGDKIRECCNAEESGEARLSRSTRVVTAVDLRFTRVGFFKGRNQKTLHWSYTWVRQAA